MSNVIDKIAARIELWAEDEDRFRDVGAYELIRRAVQEGFERGETEGRADVCEEILDAMSIEGDALDIRAQLEFLRDTAGEPGAVAARRTSR